MSDGPACGVAHKSCVLMSPHRTPMLQALDLIHAAEDYRAMDALPPCRSRKRLRTAAGLSAEVVAVAIGVTSRTLQRWESGDEPANGVMELRYRRVLTALNDQQRGRYSPGVRHLAGSAGQ